MSAISFNKEKSAGRLLALEKYAIEVGISPSEFHCNWQPLCSSSLASDLQLKPENCGGLAHIGENYDVVIDGKELRILFVGKDYGWGRSELKERQTEIQTYSGEPNSHYKGVIKVLMEVFQERCESDSWRHLLWRMAQTNATRCTAPRDDQTGKPLMKSNITHTMRTHCWSHFRKELELLEPTLIWFHDADAQSFFSQVARKEGLPIIVPFEQHQECLLVEWTVFPRPFKSVLAFFHHPAFGHFGRQWTIATDLIARLRESGYLPMFSTDWKSLEKREWPTI
jgi:hypothetical protein